MRTLHISFRTHLLKSIYTLQLHFIVCVCRSFDSKKQREFKEDLLEKLKSELARELKDFLKGELSSVKDEVGKHNSISHTPLSSPACWQKEDHRIGIIKEDPGTPISTEDMQDPS